MKTLNITIIYFALTLFKPLFGQIKVIDKKTKEPIPSVYFISEKGTVLGFTNINGICNPIIKGNLVELSHISYKKKKIKLKKSTTIELEENTNTLDEILITGKNHKDYLVLKGYFRSYQIDNDIPKSFMDGIVEYFIPTKKNKVKFKILANRTLKNDSIFNIKIKKRKFIGSSASSGDTSGPCYVEKKTLLNSEELQQSDIKLINTKIFRKNELIGKISLDTLNKITDVTVDLVTPKSQYTKSLLGFKSKFTNISIKEGYSFNDSLWNDKANLLYRTKYIKSFRSYKRNHKEIKVESYSEFYVLEKKYISKKEFKKQKTSSFYGPQKSSYKNKFWLDSKLKNIPKLPNFINELLNKKLIQY